MFLEVDDEMRRNWYTGAEIGIHIQLIPQLSVTYFTTISFSKRIKERKIRRVAVSESLLVFGKNKKVYLLDDFNIYRCITHA